MTIRHVNITNERTHYCVHLEDEGDDLFFLVPLENDSTENWTRLQEWLDAGNEIVDDMSNQDTHYQVQRKSEYPPLEDQLDYIYHNGVDAWKSDIIDPIKNKYPKPEA